MTGERLAWYRVASHLGRTVGELRAQLTVSEFLGWLDYLEWDDDRDTRTHYYLMSIAAEVRRGRVKEPLKVKLTDFLLRKPDEEETPKKKQDSKAIWLSFLKVDTQQKN